MRTSFTLRAGAAAALFAALAAGPAAAADDDGTLFTRSGGGGRRMTKGADTGICFRNSTATDPSLDGNQIQVVDGEASRAWRPTDKTGALWDVAAPEKLNVLKPVGQWNKVEVVANGSRLTVPINGEKTLDVDLEKYAHRATEKRGGQQLHPEILRPKGHIACRAGAGWWSSATCRSRSCDRPTVSAGRRSATARPSAGSAGGRVGQWVPASLRRGEVAAVDCGCTPHPSPHDRTNRTQIARIG